MEPATKTTEFMWSSNGAANPVQHEYPFFEPVLNDEAEMMNQLLTSYSISHDEPVSSLSYDHVPSKMVEGDQEILDSNAYFGAHCRNSSLYYWQQGGNAHDHELYSNNSKDFLGFYATNDQTGSRVVHSGHQNPWGDNAFCGDVVWGDVSSELGTTNQVESIYPSDQKLESKRKSHLIEDGVSGLEGSSCENPKRKGRNWGDKLNLNFFGCQASRVGKNVQSKKSQRSKNDDVEDDSALGFRIPSVNNSEDDSILLQDRNGTSVGSDALNLSAKTRAGRGSATDPQSLYARKRRERINERLRILQNLVPNGTKVDISTMLEEAVQYVKFLQLQIRLLSSDDLWMYAPIAYNGMDIGLDLKISQP